MSANEEDGRNAHADNATYGRTHFNGTSQSAYNDPVADISYGYDTTSTTMKPHEMRAIPGEPSGIYTVDNPIYSGVPSTSVANIHFDVYDDIRDTRERQKKLKRRKIIYLIGGMVLVLLVIITVTVLGLVLSKRKVATTSAQNQQTDGASKESSAGGPGAGSVAFLMSMTLNETFKPELKDKSSPEYMFFLKNFLTGLDSLFNGDPFYSHCVVSSLSSGSILVDFKVICKKEAKLVPLNLGEVYAKKLDCDCKIGNFKVTTGSVKSKGRQLVTEENEQNSDRNKTTSGENVESKGKNPNSGAAVLKPENQINIPGELIGHCKGASVKAMKADCSKPLCSVYLADLHKNNSTCDGKVDNFIKCLERITSCPIIAMMHVGLIFPELTGRGVLPTKQPSNHINGKSEPKDKDGLLQVKQGKSPVRSDTSFSIPSACLQQRSHFEHNKKQERENNANSSSTSKFTQNRSTGSLTNSPPVIGASLPSEPKMKSPTERKAAEEISPSTSASSIILQVKNCLHERLCDTKTMINDLSKLCNKEYTYLNLKKSCRNWGRTIDCLFKRSIVARSCSLQAIAKSIPKTTFGNLDPLGCKENPLMQRCNVNDIKEMITGKCSRYYSDLISRGKCQDFNMLMKCLDVDYCSDIDKLNNLPQRPKFEPSLCCKVNVVDNMADECSQRFTNFMSNKSCLTIPGILKCLQQIDRAVKKKCQRYLSFETSKPVTRQPCNSNGEMESLKKVIEGPCSPYTPPSDCRKFHQLEMCILKNSKLFPTVCGRDVILKIISEKESNLNLGVLDKCPPPPRQPHPEAGCSIVDALKLVTEKCKGVFDDVHDCRSFKLFGDCMTKNVTRNTKLCHIPEWTSLVSKNGTKFNASSCLRQTPPGKILTQKPAAIDKRNNCPLTEISKMNNGKCVNEFIDIKDWKTFTVFNKCIQNADARTRSCTKFDVMLFVLQDATKMDSDALLGIPPPLAGGADKQCIMSIEKSLETKCNSHYLALTMNTEAKVENCSEVKALMNCLEKTVPSPCPIKAAFIALSKNMLASHNKDDHHTQVLKCMKEQAVCDKNQLKQVLSTFQCKCQLQQLQRNKTCRSLFSLRKCVSQSKSITCGDDELKAFLRGVKGFGYFFANLSKCDSLKPPTGTAINDCKFDNVSNKIKNVCSALIRKGNNPCDQINKLNTCAITNMKGLCKETILQVSAALIGVNVTCHRPPTNSNNNENNTG